ncbi:MAG: FUSC family protein [Cellulomonadaceae bacterium]|nr:FUSC family protein [Cellulomonadaceae bacterium]
MTDTPTAPIRATTPCAADAHQKHPEEPALARIGKQFSRRALTVVRARQGRSRVKASFIPILQAGVAIAAAWLIGQHVFGIDFPFYTTIAAWGCLGYSYDRDPKKIIDNAVGVSFGVFFGYLVVQQFGRDGSHWWLVAGVVMVAAFMARFFSRSPQVANQAGTQAVIIVTAVAADAYRVPDAFSVLEGPLRRTTEVVIGGAVALVVALLLPGDPRRALRLLGAEAVGALSRTVHMIAKGVRRHDDETLEAALMRARAADPAFEELIEEAHTASRRARVSVNRRHLEELERIETRSVHAELCLRSIRVIARRAPTEIMGASAEDREHLADLLDSLSEGARLLEAAITAHQLPSPARVVLLDLAHRADPASFGEDLGIRAMVLLMRSAIVDALRACDVPDAEAQAALPPLMV